MLTAAERHQLLVEWNNTTIDYSRDKCVHELFEQQVARTPESVAVVLGDEELTYGELNARANQLAHHLRDLGVGPEVLVGVCVERSFEMMVGLLGILKAGGAYVPIDPAYPQERIAFMMKDAAVKVLVTQSRWLSVLPSHQAKVVLLDAGFPFSKTRNVGATARPNNLVYSIYTSGSTGRPKGVAVEHRNVVTLLHWAHEAFTAHELSVVLAATSICFDLSVFELFVPLTRGGKLILAQDILDLPSLQAAGEVTLINAVPSALSELVRCRGIPSSVVTVNSGGEAIKTSLVRQIYEQRTVQRVYDLYGPTEDAVYSMCALRMPDGVENIGRPISNKQAYILNEEREPVPIGVPGELYLGGDGVARGYLNRPDLTGQKFVADPFRAARDARLYRTGDLCRYLPDGNIVFLGRMDHQVKIRGFRIELGEIEVTIAQHPGVRQCVVAAREDQPGDKRLVAYVVPDNHNAVPSLLSLRDHLAKSLPGYMAPAQFVMLEKLPLTPNGKVDRKALPAPELTRGPVSAKYVAPATPNEKDLARIWTEVLKIEEIGVHDNFFELGGHSLLAAQVVSRVRQNLQAEVPIRTLFEFPTIAGLAETLPSFQNKAAASIPTLKPMPREGTLPLSFAQQRLWFLDRLEDRSTEYHISEAFRLRGELDRDALEQAVNEILARHDALRTRFVEVDGAPIQIVEPLIRIAVLIEDLSALVESERDKAIIGALAQQREQRFNLSEAPLLRIKLLRLSQRDHILGYTFHHIIYDGWSANVFNRELAALYQTYCDGRHSSLGPLKVQYSDYTLWQRQWLQGKELAQRLAYWTTKLDGVAPLLAFPTDRQRTAQRSHLGEWRSLNLPEALTNALLALSRREGVTLFMTLLAAFKVLLARYSGQNDIVIGVPIAARNQVVMEQMIGFFLSTLPMRTDLSGRPTFEEVLKRVRITALEAYTNQDLPFEKLIAKLQPERNLTHTPVFQILFNMFNFEDVQLSLAGLEVEPIPLPEPGSIWDITLYAKEEAGRIQFRAVYEPDLFEAATIETMLHRFRVLLESIVANPKQRIGALPLLTAEDRTRYSVRDNPVQVANPFVRFPAEEIEQSISSRFEKMVELHRDHLAIEARAHRWTYRELNERANAVAHKIFCLCPGGTQRIALLLEPGAPMVAAILGVLKAGKTYVPLNPAYPKARLAFVISDSQAEVIVTDASREGVAGELSAGQLGLINLDELDYSDHCDPNLVIPPDTIAYLLYTSGSTGGPKGVTQIHRNVLQHIRNYTNGLHIRPKDRVSLVAPYFDAGVMDIFGALLNGATLYPYDLHKYGFNELAAWLAREEITIYHSTPTLYRHLCTTLGEEQRFPKLRLVVMGGEKVVSRDVELFQRYFDASCIFVNGYGPTESTVTLQYYADTQTPIARHNIPVGYPTEDTEVLLLNADGEPGQVYGEIAIRSSSLAQGYWRRPELTNSVFQREPELKNARIYRTGDLGRLTANGMIEFVERKDFQVKIRGHRVELGEVETALNDSPGIKEAAVIARDKDAMETELVAYLVTEKTSKIDTKTLRRHLNEQLPTYMIPGVFVYLDKLPLTPAGKIDRKALPPPPQNGYETDDQFIGPRDEVEMQVAKIWENSLGIQSVGMTDNFFDLGGHSLLAVRLLSEVNRHFKSDLPLASLFREPTVEAIAGSIRSGNNLKSRPPGLIELYPDKRKRRLFWCPSVGSVDRFVECYKLADLLRDDFSFNAFDPAPEFINIHALAKHCVRLMREKQPHGPYAILGYCHCGHVAHEIAHQLQSEGEQVDLLAMLDSSAWDFAPSLRLKYSWLRDKFHGGPRKVIPRIAPALRRRIVTPVKKRAPENNGASETPFSIHRKIVGRHKPRFFNGEIVLFRSTDYLKHLGSHNFGWGALAGAVEIRTVSCLHTAMLIEPAVHLVAEELKKYLSGPSPYRESERRGTRQQLDA